MATAISAAISTNRRSRISGYEISKLVKQLSGENLPMNIAILGEANSSKENGFSTARIELTSAKEAIELFGDGSPIHQAMRILRPNSGDGVGGIPTFVYPLVSAVGATPTIVNLAVTGTATKNGTHKILINGRDGLDFQSYDLNIVTGDTPITISAKAVEAISNVIGCPCVAGTDEVSSIETQSKSNGISSIYKVSIDVNGTDLGVTYSTTTETAGTGTPDLADAFSKFGDEWHTIVINPYINKLGDFEAFNGTPYGKDGRYTPYEFNPFVALFGSSEHDKDYLATITDGTTARVDQVTNVLCPAPLSEMTPIEIASNMAYLVATTFQDTPHLDVNDKGYPDAIIPSDGVIGDMSQYNNRDFLIKNGCSTVKLESGYYKVQDLVTTYHPNGESPLQYNYVRNIFIDLNVKFGYDALEKLYVRDKVLIEDNQDTDVVDSISPKQWKAILFDYFDNLATRGLIRNVDFSKKSLEVQISEDNPNRFETRFRYQRTGLARIESTTAEAGF